MPELEASRTLVKSAPELWEVCSDPDSLGRHLQAFGEIRITRVEPETTVAWEGERASGTVRIEPAGWGTRVTLTAVAEAVSAPVVEPAPEVLAEPEREPESAVLVSGPEPSPAEPEPTLTEPEPSQAEPEGEVDELIPEPGGEAQAVPVTATPHRGFFKRLGGLLFKSFVSPVEMSEEAFAGSPHEESESAPELDPQALSGTETELLTDPEPSVETRSAPGPEAAAGADGGPGLGAQPEPEPEPDPEPEPEAVFGAAEVEVDPILVLQTMLNRLGSDHHRPFSRS